MRKSFFAVAVLCALGGGAAFAQSPNCTQSAVIPASAAGTIKVVADPPGSARVYVCGYTVNAGAAAGTLQLQGGTGSTCSTTFNSNLTPVYALGINGVLVDTAMSFRGMQTAPGAGLCAVITGTGPTGGVVYYMQQ